jgi:hypothetical protein
MKAGQTNIEVGTRVMLSNIKDKDFKHLNGLEGEVTHPFAFGTTKKNWLGIWLDNGEKYNIKTSEIIIL